jgi:Phage integrase family
VQRCALVLVVLDADAAEFVRAEVERLEDLQTGTLGVDRQEIHGGGSARLGQQCCCAPVYASASTPRCPPTPSSRSAPHPGCTCRSGNCTTTGTCRCNPQLVDLIDDYRTRYVPSDHPLLLPRENGRPLDRHTVTRLINRAGNAAGIGHIHPHQLRHTLATQAINRGMSSQAIAAMLDTAVRT